MSAESPTGTHQSSLMTLKMAKVDGGYRPGSVRSREYSHAMKRLPSAMVLNPTRRRSEVASFGRVAITRGVALARATQFCAVVGSHQAPRVSAQGSGKVRATLV